MGRACAARGATRVCVGVCGLRRLCVGDVRLTRVGGVVRAVVWDTGHRVAHGGCIQQTQRGMGYSNLPP